MKTQRKPIIQKTHAKKMGEALSLAIEKGEELISSREDDELMPIQTMVYDCSFCFLLRNLHTNEDIWINIYWCVDNTPHAYAPDEEDVADMTGGEWGWA